MSDPAPQRSRNWGPIWLAVVLVVMLVCMGFAIGVSPLVEGTAATIKGLNKYKASESTGRLLGTAAGLVLLLSELGVIGYASLLLCRTSLRAAEWGALVTVFVVWIFAAWSVDFGKAMGGEYALALEFDLRRREAFESGYWRLLDTLNAAGAITPGLVGAALGAILHRVADLEPQGLAVRTRHYTTLLYLTIALLLSGTFFVFSINRWSALVGDPVRREAALLLSSGIVLNVGVFYTVLLVAAFVPAALLLMRAIDDKAKYAVRVNPRLELPMWRRENRLDFSPLTRLRTYFALSSPLIASAIQTLLL